MISMRTATTLLTAGLLAWPGLLTAAHAQQRQNDGRKPYVRDPDRFIKQSVRSWRSLKRENIVMQRYDYSCGAAALATLVRYYWGDPVTEDQVLRAILSTMTVDELRDRIENGLTMTDLRQATVRGGYLASIGRRDFRDLYKLKVPVIVRIVHKEYEHFVVFRGIINDRVFLADPARGNIRVSIDTFIDEWNEGSPLDGVILVIAKPDVDPPEDAPLLVHPRYCTPIRHELQVPQRVLVLDNPQP